MEKIHPAHIGFDIDGVVADTGGAFIRIASDEYGLQSLTLNDITYFELEECLAIDREVIEAIFTRLHDDPLGSGIRPMKGAVEVLHRLAGQAPLTFVTARPDREPIDKWLHRYLAPPAYKEMRLIAMGEHDNKPPYIKKLGLHYFVDDRLQTCRQLSREGITPLVFTQPWNMNGHDLRKVDSWKDIGALCFG